MSTDGPIPQVDIYFEGKSFNNFLVDNTLLEYNKTKTYTIFLICLNIFLQVTTFCLMKFSSIYSNHSILKLINYLTLLAVSAVFLRAIIWQHILKMNDLSTSYLFNATIPSLLLIASHFLFKGYITNYNIMGSVIILIGLLLLFKSAEEG